MSRPNQNRHGESRGKKAAAAAQATEGNGQQPAAHPNATSAPADPAAFDAALDAFVTRAQRDFAGASSGGGSMGKGAYHPAPTNWPIRFLALGLTIGLAVGLLAALALR